MKNSIKTGSLMLLAFIVGMAAKTIYVDTRIANGNLAYEVVVIHNKTVTVWYDPKQSGDLNPAKGENDES